ncbi:MAG: DUF3823 domain-containing protein [Dysgonamonadaceae bacterium]|jgi:hypothetical protein|nr:DUF3823 domain-containing protein [Dysgonamonadaceae bacterium]
MKNMKIFGAAICTFLCMVSCVNELDNYNPPNGGIKGKILDAETNEPVPLPVQGSTGTIINLFELNTDATMSVDFYAKYDGTYEHAKVFNGDYSVVVNGPFVNPCEGKVTVKGQTTFDLKATPYARIDASASVSGTGISIRYNVVKTNESFQVSEVYGYWNFAPGVDNGSANYAGKVTVRETSGTVTFDLGNDGNYKDNLHKIQSNGNKIYVRIGALTENSINYSTILTVTL